MEKTPNELIEIQKAAKKHTGEPHKNRVLEGKVKNFMTYLEKEGRSTSTRKLVYVAIISFFKYNLFPLNMMPKDSPSG